MRLDRARSFGKISGDVFIPDGCDRPALYEQDGKFFDAHDRVILAGVTESIVPTEDPPEAPETAPAGPMTVADLIRQADTMHWRTFKKAAQQALGPDCPETKALIVAALREAQGEFEARAAKRKAQAANPAPEPPAAVSKTGVDLAAWARGQQEYLWGDVRKAIKTEYGRNVSERDDAVEFLIGQGIVAAAEARQDVIREAE